MGYDLPKGFHVRRSERCEDCDLRGALDLLGRPILRGGVRLSSGCMGCGGTGRVPATRKIDPYWSGTWKTSTK